MSSYFPDKWVMLKFLSDGKTTYKIFASWSGSYLYGDSWQLNSGCVKMVEEGDYYLFYGHSGSVYHCHRKMYGMTGYTHSIFESFKKKFDETKVATIELMPSDTDFTEIVYNE